MPYSLPEPQGRSRCDGIGAGVIYAVSDRVTLDLGYRYYSVSASRGYNYPQPDAGILYQFLSSDILLRVRIYEPFRNWR